MNMIWVSLLDGVVDVFFVVSWHAEDDGGQVWDTAGWGKKGRNGGNGREWEGKWGEVTGG